MVASLRFYNTGAISLFGDSVYGIYAQSVGGGGGVAGDISLLISTASTEDQTPDSVEITSSAVFNLAEIDPFEQAALTFAIDFLETTYAGVPLNGPLIGRVLDSRNQLQIEVNGLGGDVDDPIFGFGIGGADKSLGVNIDGTTCFFSAAALLDLATGRISSFTQRTGDGGDVDVISSGTIIVGVEPDPDSVEEEDDQSAVDPDSAAFSAYAGAGIFAQSVGGGGGILGLVQEEDIDAFGFAGTKGGIGFGGEVEVSHSGDILVSTVDGYAIFAQSVGCTEETSNAVSQAAEILRYTPGELGFDTNLCGNTGGNIKVTVDAGLIQGGSGAGGVAVFFC